MIPQYTIAGTVSLKGTNYTDPEFFCTNIKNADGSYCMKITLTTESDLELEYDQTAGYVDNDTILASITELDDAVLMPAPVPPNT